MMIKKSEIDTSLSFLKESENHLMFCGFVLLIWLVYLVNFVGVSWVFVWFGAFFRIPI